MDRRAFVVHSIAGAGTFLAGADCRAGLMTTTVAAEVSVAPDPKQFLTWDGGSGPNRAFWSQKLLLPWSHPGTGDWLDALQVPQGTAAYATAAVNAMGNVSLNVTTLVKRWITSGENRGFYIRSTQVWPFVFAGRTHATVTARPRLQVVSTNGSFDVPCTANAMWSPSSYLSKDSRSTFTVQQSSQFAVLQFDLSAVSGTVQSAILVLTCLTLKYPGSLNVLELNPPKFRAAKGTLPVLAGIANGYSYDHGVSAHPSVLFASDFADLSKQVWQTGTAVAGSSLFVDAQTASTQLRGLIPKGQLQGCDLERSLVRGTAQGTPDRRETELYARYYVFLESDWGSSVDANKMPGWDGRFGWWNSVGYWQATTGNGGSRPTGLKVRNVTANRWEYQGASMRGHGGMRANDGNPYDDLFWIGSYMYHLDQATSYGESITWPGVVLAKGRWYCIEQYMKMNSVVGPFDANGNGIAVNDGKFMAWVDGVPAYERTNFRWRRHLEMGIQGFWLNWFHGGTAAAPRDMHFRMDSVVIARNYIGPRNEGA
ncbi:MAG: hypothetical protein V4858_00145 [Pseudomonadota bacterium]